jgi:predicted DNA-binding ribbon-helix-helix protein
MATTEPNELPVAAWIAKRSLVVSGHRTSISLEGIFWNALKEVATARNVSVARLVADIDATRGPANLSSAIRVFLFSLARDRDISTLHQAENIGRLPSG